MTSPTLLVFAVAATGTGGTAALLGVAAVAVLADGTVQRPEGTFSMLVQQPRELTETTPAFEAGVVHGIAPAASEAAPPLAAVAASLRDWRDRLAVALMAAGQPPLVCTAWFNRFVQPRVQPLLGLSVWDDVDLCQRVSRALGRPLRKKGGVTSMSLVAAGAALAARGRPVLWGNPDKRDCLSQAFRAARLYAAVVRGGTHGVASDAASVGAGTDVGADVGEDYDPDEPIPF